MKLAFLCPVLFLIALSSSQARNLPAGVLTSRMTIETRLGTFNDAIRSAPKPVLPTRTGLSGRGVFIIDIDPSNGVTVSVRVLQSTGRKQLDELATEALRQWSFRPRTVYKVSVPIEFKSSGRILVGS